MAGIPDSSIASKRILVAALVAAGLFSLLEAPRFTETLKDWSGPVPALEPLCVFPAAASAACGADSARAKAATLFSLLTLEGEIGRVSSAPDKAATALSAETSSGPRLANGTAGENIAEMPARSVNGTLSGERGADGTEPAELGPHATERPAAPAAVPAPVLSANSTQRTLQNGTAGVSRNGTALAGETAAETKDAKKPLVLLTGDSMMMEGLGPVLLKELRARPDLTVRREARYSTGLSRMDYFDWPAEMVGLVAEYRPDLVIISLGANDAQDIIDWSGKRHHADADSWAVRYQERVELLTVAAQSLGAKVIWVGLPIMGDEPHARRTVRLSGVQKAACGEGDGRFYVDTYAVLADDKGNYAAFLKGADGKSVRVRYKDKIHVTEDGGKLMAATLMPVICTLYPPPPPASAPEEAAGAPQKSAGGSNSTASANTSQGAGAPVSGAGGTPSSGKNAQSAAGGTAVPQNSAAKAVEGVDKAGAPAKKPEGKGVGGVNSVPQKMKPAVGNKSVSGKTSGKAKPQRSSSR